MVQGLQSLDCKGLGFWAWSKKELQVLDQVDN